MSSLVQSELKINDVLKPGNRVHFIGIGGIGMSGLAKVLNSIGYQVSGSDAKSSRETRELQALGVPTRIGHDFGQSDVYDFVIYSSAVSMKNPERRGAIMRGVPLFHRAELLSALMNQAISIAVTGTHGKTTTSAMISYVLVKAGIKPTCLLGGRSLDFDSNVHIGDPHLVVAEVDESDRSHLFYQPDYTIITNLEEDHLDVYKNVDDLKSSFMEFVSGLKTTGHLIYCGHDERLKDVARLAETAISYGLSKEFRFGAEEITFDGFRSKYRLYENGKKGEMITLSVPGRHNVLNSVGAIAVMRVFGLPVSSSARLISEFRGVSRRLEIKADTSKLVVIDDYAHHPTEIIASLQAIRTLKKKITAVFQPHRYSRTHLLCASFAGAFEYADRVILTDIYSAGEENVYDFDVKNLFELMKQKHDNVVFVPQNELMGYLSSDTSLDGALAFLGAGDITEIANEFSKRVLDTK